MPILKKKTAKKTTKKAEDSAEKKAFQQRGFTKPEGFKTAAK